MLFSVILLLFILVAVAAIGHGVLRTIHADRHVHPNIVPVDVVINLICAVAWKTAVDNTESGT